MGIIVLGYESLMKEDILVATRSFRDDSEEYLKKKKIMTKSGLIARASDY